METALSPAVRRDPLLAPSPQSTGGGGVGGVGQASPQGISGPIPPPSPRLGLAAVNELHGDPGAPRTQGKCPELGLDGGGGGRDGGWGREKERAEKGEKETGVEKRENGEKRRQGGGGAGKDGQSQEKREERQRKRKQWMWKNQRETVTKTKKNQERHRESQRGHQGPATVGMRCGEGPG